MKWLLVVSLTAVAAMAAGQNVALPDGDGKAIVTASCGGCHGVDLITAKLASRADWATTVERMKTYGSTLNAQQTTTVVDYLAKSFPPKTAAPAASAEGQAGDPDAEAKAMVTGVCASCHGADLITTKKADKTEWQGIVDRMKNYGMTITPTQTSLLVDYLAKAYGTAPPATATADPGKKIFEDFCGSCHDLDLSANRKASAGEWQEIVDRMNGRGAGVPDAQVGTLVQYLAKTYGPNN